MHYARQDTLSPNDCLIVGALEDLALSKNYPLKPYTPATPLKAMICGSRPTEQHFFSAGALWRTLLTHKKNYLNI